MGGNSSPAAEFPRAYKTINPDVYQTVLPFGLATPYIVKQLREVVSSIVDAPTQPVFSPTSCPRSDLPVVVTQRATGKTTGLVDFVAERTLVTNGEKTIAVVAPSDGIIQEFKRRFKENYPALRPPLFVVAGRIPSALIAQKIDEIYIEEVFMFKRGEARTLLACAPVVVGVGSIEQPRTITIKL